MRYSTDGLFVLNSQGEVVAANDKCESLLGYTPAEIKGKLAEDILPDLFAGDSLGRWTDYLVSRDEHEMGSGLEIQGRRKDGSLVWLELATMPFDTDIDQFVLIFVRDISVRKTAEEEVRRLNEGLETRVAERTEELRKARNEAQEAGGKIRRSEEFLQTLLDTSPVAFSISSKDDGRYLMVNRSGAEQSRLSAAEMLQRNIKDLYFDPEDRTELFRQLVETGKLDGVDLHARRLGTGEEYWLAVSARFIDYEGQEAILSISVDITERKKAEEALREARDAALDATKAKDMFLAAMSHEIRTPMNGVMGMIELIQTTPISDDQMQMLGTAKDSASQLLTIINDILDFSKIEAGKMEMDNRAFDPRKAADVVGEILGVMAAEKGRPLIVHVQSGVPPLLLGDEVRIRQILLNLAGNAVKFTDKGEVHIGIKLGDARDDGAAAVIYEITDSGIGMTEEQVSRLFTPFEQADASTSRRYGGTGLGLSIVARLTEMMGGKVEVESELGKGSTFRVTLPHGAVKADAAEAAIDLGPLKILALSAADSRMDLLTQILEGEDQGRLESLDPSSKPGEVVAALLEAEAAGKPFDLVYLTAGLGHSGQEELRRTIIAGERLKNQPKFVIERHSTTVAPDGPVSVLVPVTPVLESHLRRALAIVTGKASPSIAEPGAFDSKADEVLSIEEAEAARRLILVAEDNKTNQYLIGRQLALLGYTHEIADDGRIALRMLSERAYGLLLSDMHMPNMDGYELIRAIRDKEIDSGTRLPVVAISANALQGEGERCMEMGMDGYLPKPMGLKELRECLEAWLPDGGVSS